MHYMFSAGTRKVFSIPARFFGIPSNFNGIPAEFLGIPIIFDGIPLFFICQQIFLQGIPSKFNGIPTKNKGIPLKNSGIPKRLFGCRKAEARSIFAGFLTGACGSFQGVGEIRRAGMARCMMNTASMYRIALRCFIS
jgi:hypothetical protein